MTSALLGEALAPLRHDPARSAILFDIDGTLAPIVSQPADARVPEATRQLLAALARRYGAVACVSGRRASEARAMVSVGSITYLGSHGAELLRAGWTEAAIDPALEDWARRIRQFGREADTPELRRLGVRLEDKHVIAAFHWRGAPDEAAARAALDALAGRAEASGLRTHWGRKVLEVRPPIRFDKGQAVRALLSELEVVNALYVGDDHTDLDVFRALDELRARGRLANVVRVGVASEEGPEEVTAEADVVVDGPEGVVDLLALLVADER